jgi:hypothetical protein
MSTDPHVTQDLYDVELVRIDAHTGTLCFAGGHLLTLARREELRWWHVGEIGVLRLGVMPRGRPYPDQRLRRAPERDDVANGRWHGGSFAPIPDVPMNTFLQRSVRQQPAAVLRAFIADVCALKSLATYPREDGYCSVGSHERRLARDYFDRAYGMYLEDVEQ